MADTKNTNKSFFDRLDKYVKIGGLGLLFFLIFRSGEGRRAARQLRRFTGVNVSRAALETGEAYQQLTTWGAEECERLLTHGVWGASLILLFGIGAIITAGAIPNLMVEGLVISTLLIGIILAVHGLMAAVIPIWAIVSGVVGAGKKAGELEVSQAGLKKAPAWFFGSLQSAGGEVAVQIGSLYRWFTRMIGWVGASSAYIWIVPFHQAPELLAGLAIPIITVFYAFNQGWRAEVEHNERGSVWKGVVIATALLMLNMAFLAHFPEIHDPLMAAANPGNLLLRSIMWVLIVIQMVCVYRWSTAGSSPGSSSGTHRVRLNNSNWLGFLIFGLIILAGVWMYMRYEMDTRQAPARIVQNELGKRGAWLPGPKVTPTRRNGDLQYDLSWGSEPSQVVGDGHFPNHDPESQIMFDGNLDSLGVVIDVTRMGWNEIGLRVNRGDVIHYRVLTPTYLYDGERMPVSGWIFNGKKSWPSDRPEHEHHFITTKAPCGALIIALGEGVPQAMVVPGGRWRLPTHGVLHGQQSLRVAFNLPQVGDASAHVNGQVRIRIWIERGGADRG